MERLPVYFELRTFEEGRLISRSRPTKTAKLASGRGATPWVEPHDRVAGVGARWRTLLVVTLLLIPAHAKAYGWVRAPGSVYLKASGGMFSSEHSEERADLRYEEWAARFYGEFGVFPGHQVVLQGAYLEATNRTSGDGPRYRHRGPGDVTLGLRSALTDGATATSLGLDVKVPTYQPASSLEGYATGAGRFPELGEGEVDVTGRFEVGVSLYPLPGWVSGYGGYRHRRGIYRDSLVFGVDGGATVVGGFGLSMGSDAVLADDADRVTPSWWSVRLALQAQLGEMFDLELLGTWLPWTRNTEAGQGMSVGLSWKHP